MEYFLTLRIFYWRKSEKKLAICRLDINMLSFYLRNVYAMKLANLKQKKMLS